MCWCHWRLVWEGTLMALKERRKEWQIQKEVGECIGSAKATRRNSTAKVERASVG